MRENILRILSPNQRFMIRFTHRVFLVVVHWLRSRDDCWGVSSVACALVVGRCQASRWPVFFADVSLHFAVPLSEFRSLPSSLCSEEKSSLLRHCELRKRRVTLKKSNMSGDSATNLFLPLLVLERETWRDSETTQQVISCRGHTESTCSREVEIKRVTRNQAEINVLGFELSYSSIL